jgi:hypothetical protein
MSLMYAHLVTNIHMSCMHIMYMYICTHCMHVLLQVYMYSM